MEIYWCNHQTEEGLSNCPSRIARDKVRTSELDVANQFNQHFCDIGPSLASSIGETNGDPTKYINNTPENRFYLSTVLLFYYKCNTGFLNVNMDKFVNLKNTRLTWHSSALDTRIPKCRTKLFQASFFNRLPKIWNSLSSFAGSAISLHQFQSFLHKHYFTALTNAYDIRNFNTLKSVCTKCSSHHNILSS